MENIVKRKLCMEWAVQTTTTYGHAIKSEVFMCQGNKCHFEFHTGYPRAGCNYFYFKSEKKLKYAINIRVFIEWRDGPTILESKSFDGCATWYLKYEMRGCPLTCNAIIESDFQEEDKCVQTASYLNPEVSVENFTKDFSGMLEVGMNHDAEIKCGDHSIKAHKIILCARSEVFRKMLESNMLEGRTGTVEIQDIDIGYLKDFIKYLYTAEMPEMTFDKAVALYEVGDKYAVFSLKIRCSEYLQDILSPENIFQCFALADIHSDEQLIASVKSYLLHEKVYLQDEYWLPFCDSYPKVAIEIYRLSHENNTQRRDD